MKMHGGRGKMAVGRGGSTVADQDSCGMWGYFVLLQVFSIKTVKFYVKKCVINAKSTK